MTEQLNLPPADDEQLKQIEAGSKFGDAVRELSPRSFWEQNLTQPPEGEDANNDIDIMIGQLGHKEALATLLDSYAANEKIKKYLETTGEDGSALDEKNKTIEEYLGYYGDLFPKTQDIIINSVTASKNQSLSADELVKGPELAKFDFSGGESDPRISVQDSLKLLSYGDVLPEEKSQEAVNSVIDQENGIKYAQQLSKLTAEHGLPTVLKHAEALTQECKKELTKLGITPSAFGESQSWALWDMAKHARMFEHPEENGDEYKVGDPMQSDEKMNEILHRHVGWETYRALHDKSEDELKKMFFKKRNRDAIVRLIKAGPKKGKDTLASHELAKLGEFVSS